MNNIGFSLNYSPNEKISVVDIKKLHSFMFWRYWSLLLGFIPRERGRFGQRFTVQATEALSEFEKMNMKDKAALNQLIKLGALQNGNWDPKNLDDKEVCTCWRNERYQ